MTPRFQLFMTLLLVLCSAAIVSAVLSHSVSREAIQAPAAALCFMGVGWVGMLLVSMRRPRFSRAQVSAATSAVQGEPTPLTSEL